MVKARSAIDPVRGIFAVEDVAVITEPGIQSQLVVRAHEAFDLARPDTRRSMAVLESAYV